MKIIKNREEELAECYQKIQLNLRIIQSCRLCLYMLNSTKGADNLQLCEAVSNLMALYNEQNYELRDRAIILKKKPKWFI